jgi:type II secretory ATPase GspE/PulE/Tfp pilus assembly ATPase PilB-like protein
VRLAQAYAREDAHAAQIMDDLEQEIDLTALAQDIPAVGDLLESEDDAPIIRLINALLAQALREGASDIHLEAYENRSVIRYRVDGMLRDVMTPPRALHAALVSRIKVMASLDIAEKRLPQDGRITLRVAGRAVDVRVSTLPTGHGERVVLRLLDKQHGRLELEALGMNPVALAGLDRSDSRTARHHSGHRSDRFGQDHHAICGAVSPGRRQAEHHDGGRPDRVRPRSGQSDACESAHRTDLRPRACAPSCGKTRMW